MSSLLQFNGRITKRGVGLQFITEKDTYTCSTCGRVHERIYIAFRKPAGMFGCWVVFRYNGEEHVPDLSIPIMVDRLPKDAKPTSDLESSTIWHS